MGFAVSIVTRTHRRTPLLARACASVDAQRDAPPWQHIIVNDGGDPAPVDAVLADFPASAPNHRSILHRPHSTGMEAASNAGLECATAPLIAIHDDDDSWDPAFLYTLTRFLQAPANARFCGAVCRTTQVLESIVDGEVRVLRTQPFNPQLRQIDFASCLRENLFPPISFVFRRALLEAIGPFDPTLPVLGDWEFNLRALSHAPIALLDAELARYHHRVNATTEPSMANSIHTGDPLHRATEAQLRARWNRSNPFGLPATQLALYSQLCGHAAHWDRTLHRLKATALALPTCPPPQS